MFAEIRQRVTEGRWKLAGGWWGKLASDGQAVPFTMVHEKIRFEVAGLETLEMVEIC